MPCVQALAPIDIVIGVILCWIGIGAAALLFPLSLRLATRVLLPAGAVAAVLLAAAGFTAMTEDAAVRVLPLGLPDLPFHLRLDALSAYFLVLLGLASAGISIYYCGYLRAGEDNSPGLTCLQYHLFLASMAAIFVADDCYLFMVAWETMALSSYFLVTSSHRDAATRAAGFLYLVIAHIGAIGILLCFGVLQGDSGDYTFATMREVEPSSMTWATVAFLLALFGFGAKAGVLPLHVWLPDAHPAAPSPVSALMSGVMLKTAIYGLLRVTFDLLNAQVWWWGVLTLALGLITALYGVLFAAVQTDMKRLLAYSSIENIGFVLIGIGLAMTFRAFDMSALAALALVAALYHCLNHAFFKSLLFLATGSVLHATRERSVGKLGGLIHRMPVVAWLALIGTLAIAGLPPLNGFVSEWLLLQAFLLTPGLPNSYLNMLVPVAAAALALSAALSGYVMVKFYGMIFLGQPREEKLADVHDAGAFERVGMLWLAIGCVLLGVLPVLIILQLGTVTTLLLADAISDSVVASGWLFITPIAPDRASYSPLIFLLVILGVLLVVVWLVRRFYHGRMRRSAVWDCGFPLQTPRMQDSPEGFSQPIRRIFEVFFGLDRHFPSPFDRQPYFYAKVEDRLWHLLYLPVMRAVERVSAWVGKLQRGRIHVYLIYSFATLLLLLAFAR
jgi:formate hydrogenlyase subunit 3/multisubunit Na+/H+ antiporter MnhD subunit